jgi:hypothetical protein
MVHKNGLRDDPWMSHPGSRRPGWSGGYQGWPQRKDVLSRDAAVISDALVRKDGREQIHRSKLGKAADNCEDDVLTRLRREHLNQRPGSDSDGNELERDHGEIPFQNDGQRPTPHRFRTMLPNWESGFRTALGFGMPERCGDRSKKLRRRARNVLSRRRSYQTGPEIPPALVSQQDGCQVLSS